MIKRLSLTTAIAVFAALLAVGGANEVASAEPPLPTQSSECGSGFLTDYVPCVPIAPDGDWNCSDAPIKALNSAIRIDMGDPYGFDADGDGYGCDGNGARPPVLPAAVVCDGRLATIIGSAGDDIIEGTSGDDVISGLGGDDLIYGLEGNDVICGDGGRDRLLGGRGNDLLIGGKKNDILKGDGGQDILFGQSGNDRLFGGGGRDSLYGGSGLRDTLKGKGGADSCVDRQGGTIFETCETY